LMWDCLRRATGFHQQLPYPTCFYRPQHTEMSEKYAEIEACIKEACENLNNCEKPNVAAVAREFEVPETRLCARWNGRQSRQGRPAAGRKLTEDQELAVCPHLKQLDTIGTSARFPMVTGCADFILRQCHPDHLTTPPPTVGPNWTTRFLERHPNSIYENRRRLIDITSF